VQNNIEIIYEDEDILALSKPAGIVVHHDAKHISDTIVDWLLKKYPNLKGVGDDPERPGIVHRLDKDTSGVLIVARNQKTFLYLKNLFQTGGVQKIYLALVVGFVKKDSDIINAAIARSTKYFEKRVVGGKQGRSREAITEYHVRERFKEEYTLLDVSPKTGRTHQIRSHMAHIGHPIACDKLYGGRLFVCPAGLERQFLHAVSIEFVSPSGAQMHFDVPLAEDLEKCLTVLRK
jgi:23S rRNA pseudouridine1911/1915/1917 synthase